MNHDEIIAHYRQSGSIKETSRWSGVSEQCVRRILVIAGEYSSSRSMEISKMADDGMTTRQIAEELGIKEKTVMVYTDYRRGPYILGEKTPNAIRIKSMRERRRKDET